MKRGNDLNILILENISKKFGEDTILKNISLTVESGEFLTLLGPSGCGKTTTLRIISGLETVDGGNIILDNENVTKKEPNLRDVNTVFQNYALFPHMTVFDNIAYPLKIRKVKKDVIKSEVEKMLDLVKMKNYSKRKPDALSGGEKQRIAIARSLINKPKVLLLDEPLGALDLKLRKYMQIELKRLQKQLGITFIYVTHDQDEALNMSDRIAVMNKGKIEQIDSPKNVYNFPKTKFAAEFVGDRNIFKPNIVNNKIYIFEREIENNSNILNKDIYVSILSDKVNIKSEQTNYNDIKAKIVEKHYTGSQISYFLTPEVDKNSTIKSVTYNDSNFSENDYVYVNWNNNDLVFVQ